MNRQYNLVNECLNLLRQRGIDTVHKLRIDFQLTQLKALLLVREMDAAAADAFMVSLLGTCRKISRLEGGESASAAFEEVINELHRLIGAVAGGTGFGGEGSGMSTVGAGVSHLEKRLNAGSVSSI